MRTSTGLGVVAILFLIRPRAVGADAQEEWKVHRDAGMAAVQEEKYAEAEKEFRAAYDISQHLNARDLRRADSGDDMAMVLTELGRFREAERFGLKALEFRRRVQGRNHPAVTRSLHALARIYDGVGNDEKAASFYKQLIALMEKTRGREDRSVGGELLNLARIYGRQGKFRQAETLYKRSLKIMEKVHRPDDPEVALSLLGLGTTYDHLGQPAQAIPLYERALAIQKNAYGPESPDLVSVLTSLGASTPSWARMRKPSPTSAAPWRSSRRRADRRIRS